jgi:hypothetical protein
MLSQVCPESGNVRVYRGQVHKFPLVEKVYYLKELVFGVIKRHLASKSRWFGSSKELW